MTKQQTTMTFVLGLTLGYIFALFPRLLKKLSKKYFKKQPTLPAPATPATIGSTNKDSTMEQLEHAFRLPTHHLHEIVKHFQSELQKGLSQPNQTIKALPSFVTRRPTGNETGTFLALDFGGTNLRVCEVVLEGRGKYRMRHKKHVISHELKVGEAKELFDFIAESVSSFLNENQIEGGRKDHPPLQLGFTFSYPVNQQALNSGTLMHWNKGFEVKNTVGRDVCELLSDAFVRKELNIEIVAIVNDTVGTLMAHAYKDPDTFIGVIIGTGSNAAYLEKVKNIPKYHVTDSDAEVDEMIINIEWGAFDEEKLVLPVTQYDVLLDQSTENPGKQIFEKMISGMYLGEIARLVMVDLIHSGLLFSGHSSSALMTAYRFETQFMSRIERDHSQELSDTKALLEDLFQITSSLSDRQLIKRICELIGSRAARLSAAAVAGVIMKMNRLNGCTVAIDGSVYEHYPHFRNRMMDALKEIFGMTSDNVQLALARDGSGVGAALIAAVMG